MISDGIDISMGMSILRLLGYFLFDRPTFAYYNKHNEENASYGK